MSDRLPFDLSHQPWNNGEGGPLMCGRCAAVSGSLEGSRRCRVELAEVMARAEARPPIGPPPGDFPKIAPTTIEPTTAVSRTLVLQSAAAMLADVVRKFEHWLVCSHHDSHEGISISSMTLAGEAEMGEAERAARRALALYESVRDGNCWQPIETAPKDGTTILVGNFWQKNRVVTSAVWIDDSDQGAGWHEIFAWPTAGRIRYDLTHWMPLPEPPK